MTPKNKRRPSPSKEPAADQPQVISSRAFLNAQAGRLGKSRVSLMARLNFRHAKAGHVFIYNGWRYVIDSITPYITKHGRKARLFQIRTRCVECGESFDFSVPTVANFLTKRCLDHRRVGPWGAK